MPLGELWEKEGLSTFNGLEGPHLHNIISGQTLSVLTRLCSKMNDGSGVPRLAFVSPLQPTILHSQHVRCCRCRFFIICDSASLDASFIKEIMG